MRDLRTAVKAVAKASQRLSSKKSALRSELDRVSETKAELEAAKKAQAIMQEAAERVQRRVHVQMAGLVSRCLKQVFGEEAYEFRVRFEKKRGKTEAKLLFARDGVERSPADETGLGQVDVAAFALRLACVLMQRPSGRRLLVLDEPFKWVSAEYRGRVRELLEGLSSELGVQIIMTTHAAELVCGSVVKIGGGP